MGVNQPPGAHAQASSPRAITVNTSAPARTHSITARQRDGLASLATPPPCSAAMRATIPPRPRSSSSPSARRSRAPRSRSPPTQSCTHLRGNQRPWIVATNHRHLDHRADRPPPREVDFLAFRHVLDTDTANSRTWCCLRRWGENEGTLNSSAASAAQEVMRGLVKRCRLRSFSDAIRASATCSRASTHP